MMREEEWIEAARQGDQDAFAELVRLYEKRVFALTTRMCRNPEDAAEAAQEAFLSGLAGAAVFPGEASFSTCSIAWPPMPAWICCAGRAATGLRQGPLWMMRR